MEEKNYIMNIDLDSNEFEDKVLHTLSKGFGVNTTIMAIRGEKQEGERFTFLLMNFRSSKRKKCPACNGYHWYFVSEFETPDEKDKGGLCNRCGNILTWLVYLKIDKATILKWMKSKGDINPIELLKDGVEKMIKKGEIKVFTKEKKKGQ